MAEALAEGVANGLREHVPGAVGIIIKSAAVCASAAIAHFALAVPAAPTAIGATTVGVTSYLILIRKRAGVT
jgi:CHASE2 domain-containing sensor protein